MESGYIAYLKLNQPQIWLSLKKAAADGLIFIDEEADAITASNRLLLTYPNLHEVLNLLVESWMNDTILKNNPLLDEWMSQFASK